MPASTGLAEFVSSIPADFRRYLVNGGPLVCFAEPQTRHFIRTHANADSNGVPDDELLDELLAKDWLVLQRIIHAGEPAEHRVYCLTNRGRRALEAANG